MTTSFKVCVSFCMSFDNVNVGLLTQNFRISNVPTKPPGNRGTRSRSRSNTPDPFPRQRRRISSKHPTLPASRLTGDRSVHLHVRVPGGTQRACAYCSYLRAVAKAQGDTEELPEISRVVMNCSACNVRLCKPHFDAYHGWDAQEE